MKKILLFISLGLVSIVNAAPPSGLGGTSLSGSGGTATVTSNSIANLGFATTNTLPYVRIFPNGTAYGPAGKIDTSTTTTIGINEAIHSLFQTNAVGIAVGGGVVILEAGVYDLSTNITIPEQFNFQLQIRGAGKGTTTLINSSMTNMFCLEKTTPSDIGNGGSKPFMFTISDMTLAQRYDTNKQAIIFLNGKLNQGVIENCAFASLQCLAFTNKISSNPVGQGGGLLFISGTPTNAVGVVGIWINGGFDNKTLIRKCDFYGMAAGIFDGQDHTAITDIMGTACGRWYDIGTITPHNGTAWTPIGTFGNHSQGNNNLLSVGGVIIANDPIYDFTMDRCYFFESVCGLLNVGINFGANIRMLNPFWETCAYQVLFSRDENDEHLGQVSIVEQGSSGAPATIANYGYVGLTNGAITLSNPTTEAQLMRLKLGPSQFKISDVRSRQLFLLDGDTSLGSPASGDVTILGKLNVASNLTVSGNTVLNSTTSSVMNVTGQVRLLSPTNAATIVNLGLDANGNVSSNAVAIGGGTTYPSQVWTNGLSFVAVASNNITVDKFHSLIASNVVQAGSPATADNGQVYIYGTNGHLFRFQGLNPEGVDQSGVSLQSDGLIIGNFGTNHFSFLKSITITNTDGRIITVPTNLFEVFTTNSGWMMFSNDASLKIKGSVQVTGSGTNGMDYVVFTNGFTSIRSNLLAPTSITAPATTVNWTNPTDSAIEVYIDNSGVTGTAIKKNNTTIFTSLVGDVTMGLQSGEYISLTYSVGTPSIKWSPR